MRLSIAASLWFLIFLPATAAEVLQAMGSTTVLPIVAEAAKSYRKDHPQVGIAAIIQGHADLGMSSRRPTPEEQAHLQGKAHLVAIARDAVAVVVSKAVFKAGIQALTLDRIATIYRGGIGNWQDLGGPDARILVIDKEAGRGTRHVFARAVLGDPRARAPGAMVVAGSNNETQAIVARSDRAIGMLSNAWLNDRVRALAVIVDGEAILPTAENVAGGRYPIRRDLYLVVPEAAPAAVRDFVAFLLSPPGQALVRRTGYLPLR